MRPVASKRSASAARLTPRPPRAGPGRRAPGGSAWPPATVCSPKWKIEAASTASARPSTRPRGGARASRPRRRRSRGPTTASAIARVSSRSYPSRVPSRSMLVSRISPAPSASTSRAQVDGVPAGRPPPAVRVDLEPRGRRQPAQSRRLASIATTMHWLPKRSAASRTSSGRATAAVLSDTLSAPARRSVRTSSRLPEPAAHRERQVDRLRRAAHDVEHRRASLVGRGDVQEHELVRALPVVGDRRLDGVAGVGEVQEPHALDDAPVLDVEARDHAAGQHRRQAATARHRRAEVDRARVEGAPDDGAGHVRDGRQPRPGRPRRRCRPRR